MSVASSFRCIKIPNSCSSSSTSNCPYFSSSFKFSSSTKPLVITIRSSQTEGPIRRPMAPSIKEPSQSPPLIKPTPPSPPSSSVSPPQKSASVSTATTILGDNNVITFEFQRQKAKELQDYFRKKKLEEANQGPFFGFIGKNEISNGRYK